jgi:hypothetical protein
MYNSNTEIECTKRKTIEAIVPGSLMQWESFFFGGGGEQFRDAVSIWAMKCWMLWLINDEVERIWKEAVVD